MDTGRTKASVSKEEVTRSGASVLVYTPHKLSGPPWPEQGLSPPTKDPGPGQTNTSPEPKLSQEIRRLQKELAIYIQKIEQLASRGTHAETGCVVYKYSFFFIYKRLYLGSTLVVFFRRFTGEAPGA